MKNLCTENYKVLKEFEKKTDKWKYIAYSWNRRINIKISILLEVIYRFNAIHIKILMVFSQNRKKSSKTHMAF